MEAAVTAAMIIASLSLLGTLIGIYNNRKTSNRVSKLEYKAEKIVKRLLSKPHSLCRSFEEISQHIGGFEDGELRRLLVRSGAIRFIQEDGSEKWALLDNCGDDLAPPNMG